jgi:tetratricopeptide (TPR) repeat protein
MCSQENLRRIDKRLLPVEILTGLKEYLMVANEIAVIGGEPFLLPNALALIEMMVSDPDYSDIKLSLFTNGTLLHRYIEKLRSIKRINLCVSLDSIGDAYEQIRCGARWNQTEQNIMTFKETAEKYNLDWTVNIAAVVMKSSIPRLVDFVDWCIKKDFPVHFVPIQPQAMQPQGFSIQEEVFTYPGLLKDIPNWEDLFNKAVDKLTEKGWISGAAKPLSLMRDEIKSRELNLKGEALFCGGDIEGAMELFTEAERKDPDYMLTYNNIGVIHWQKGEVMTALRYFINILKVDPNSREATFNCGMLLKSMGKFEDAEKIYAAYLRNHPDDRVITAALQ